MKITLEMLIRHDACNSGKTWFQEKFGEEAESDEIFAALYAFEWVNGEIRPNFDWAMWLSIEFQLDFKWLGFSCIEGVENGKYELWYENGQSRVFWNYVDGLLHGEHKIYYKNGQIHTSCHYVNNKRHGKYFFWDKDGRIVESLNYVDGVV